MPGAADKRLRAVDQCAELTEARHLYDWLADLPAQCAQEVLRHLDRAYDNWWNSRHPAGAPVFKRKRSRLAVSFPGHAVRVRRVSRRWGRAWLPKLGWVRFRWSRPLGGVMRNATVSRDGLGWHIAFGVHIPAPAAPLVNTGPPAGVDLGIACSVFLSTEQRERQRPATSPRVSRNGWPGWNAARLANSRTPRSTTGGSTATGCVAPSRR
jgi:putative transposase